MPGTGVSDEVVRLIGKLVGQGLNNVTTKTTNYDCPGAVDCTDYLGQLEPIATGDIVADRRLVADLVEDSAPVVVLDAIVLD